LGRRATTSISLTGAARGGSEIEVWLAVYGRRQHGLDCGILRLAAATRGIHTAAHAGPDLAHPHLHLLARLARCAAARFERAARGVQPAFHLAAHTTDRLVHRIGDVAHCILRAVAQTQSAGANLIA